MPESTARLVVACPDCGTRTAVEHPNAAVEAYERHKGLTGHDVEWERAELDVDAPAGDVERVLEEFAARYDAAVPIGSVTAAMSEQGVSIAETLETIHDLRMSGRLYEPEDDHLMVV